MACALGLGVLEPVRVGHVQPGAGAPSAAPRRPRRGAARGGSGTRPRRRARPGRRPRSPCASGPSRRRARARDSSSSARAASAPRWNVTPSTAARASTSRSAAVRLSMRSCSSARRLVGQAAARRRSSRSTSSATTCSANSGLPSLRRAIRPAAPGGGPCPREHPGDQLGGVVRGQRLEPHQLAWRLGRRPSAAAGRAARAGRR